ncbi:MAG TPA: SAM-dependent methyltransferase [Kofleriaceae bacterium]|jgi:SAM-dependent methyltransferase|nr:SAM-dependent methyltransferase [Kofleriaceae bacterium]
MTATRARWADEIDARARAHWTDDRLAQLLDGKRPVISPRDGAVLLRALGLSRDDTSLLQPRKYFQVNHMVALLGPAIRDLRARHAVIRLLDAGCGRSYLTLLLAWCARHVWGHPLEVVGIDRDADVIAEARRRAELAGLADVVRFEVGDVAACAELEVHGVVALHACDTATCDALAVGVARGADLLAVAPCCQAELARAWGELAAGAGSFSPIWRSPHLRRETAADITDAMRVALLSAAGYDVSAMEFVPAEHTRKNTLLVAVRHGRPGSRADYEALRDATGGADIRLARAIRVPSPP